MSTEAALLLESALGLQGRTDSAIEAAKFIQQRFEALNRCKTKRVYTRIMSIQSDVEAVHQLVEKVIQLTAK
ncbi:hypothetical protein TSMEX_007262 [Taenia solium]|eukprot:TsM_000453400 transcript=TsM_000453400 gene=TsM_000453400